MLLTKLANKEIVNFLKSVTIKNGYFAEQLKKALVNVQYWDTLPDDHNPYYMHLAGKYILRKDITAKVTNPSTGTKYTVTFPSTFQMPDVYDITASKTVANTRVYTDDAFDEMMYVTSLDTQESIPFSVETLHGDASTASAVHKKTLDAYRIPGQYFDMLCEQYPKQVDLIKSIVYLVPPAEIYSSSDDEDTLRMQRLIDAKHLELLNYDRRILEEAELQSMLDCINKTLTLIRERWDVKEFTYEENYANVQWGMVWSLLPLLMIAQRYANARTYSVHSSHVWDYLTSKGMDSYRGYLTSKQERYLYKNIQYLLENSGQHRILNYLIDNILADYKLHIEAKTMVIDKRDVLTDIPASTDYANQCESCSRRYDCKHYITEYACSEWMNKDDLYKPEPLILSESLPGARKDRVIDLLQSRYDCTLKEAEARYDRAFVWSDAAVEAIKAELDRDQSVEANGSTELLDDVIKREHAAKLEPTYNSDVVLDQRMALRTIRSNYIPTKLLEITEDPSDAKYSELFNKFVVDTLLHIAPININGVVSGRVSESYSISVGREGINFILNYNELLAALYLSFLKENALNTKVDAYINNALRTTYTTDLNNYSDFNIVIPSSAYLGTTFKLSKPIKQQDLVDAYGTTDYTALHDKVTNGTSTTLPSGVSYHFKVIQIGDSYYAVEAADKNAAEINDYVWEDYSKAYHILGKFISENSTDFTYMENNGEIGIIPKYVIWHYEHLGMRTFKTMADLNAHTSEFSLGAIVAVWRDNPGLYILKSTPAGTLGWESAAAAETTAYSKTKFTRYWDSTIGGWTTKDVIPVKQQNPIMLQDRNGHDLDEAMFVDTTQFIRDDGVYNPPSTIDPAWMLNKEFTTYEAFESYVNSNFATTYSKFELDHYLNVDWILEHLWIDFNHIVNSQDDIGDYFETMYTLMERLCTIFDNAGDIKTRLAIKTFLKAVLVDRTVVTRASNSSVFDKKRLFNFQLVSIPNNIRPTYEDWMHYNAEIGENFRKLNESVDSAVLWNELSAKLIEKVLEGCHISYTDSTTDAAKYNKLKMLVKNLSSYLINFINTSSTERIDTELSHLAEDYSSHEIKFTSYVDFSPVGEQSVGPAILNVNDDIYIPVKDTDVVRDESYYIHDTERPNDMWFIATTTDSTMARPDIVYYEKVSLSKVLGLEYNETLKVWFTLNGTTRNWYYAKGKQIEIDGTALTQCGTVRSVDNIMMPAEGDTYYDMSTSAYMVWCTIDDTSRWINTGTWNGEVETYPADKDVTSVENVKILEFTSNLLRGGDTLNNLGAQIYKKHNTRTFIAWGKDMQDAKLSDYMDKTMIHHNIISSSEWTVNISDSSDIDQVTSKMSNYIDYSNTKENINGK